MGDSSSIDLMSNSLNEVEQMFLSRLITEDELTEYLHAWNSGPHFSRAEFRDGRIRNIIRKEYECSAV